MTEQTWKVIGFIIATAAVIFAAYYVTYFLGRRQFKAFTGKNIRLRENFAVARDKSFCLIEVKGKVYLVAMSGNYIALLDTLSPEQFTEDDALRRRGDADFLSANAIQRGIVKGISYIKENWPWANGKMMNDLDDRITLQTADEEDNLDRVYREMQTRRAKRKEEESREDKE